MEIRKLLLTKDGATTIQSISETVLQHIGSDANNSNIDERAEKMNEVMLDILMFYYHPSMQMNIAAAGYSKDVCDLLSSMINASSSSLPQGSTASSHSAGPKDPSPFIISLIDALWMASLDIQEKRRGYPQLWTNFLNLVIMLKEKQLIPLPLAVERLDRVLVEESGIMNDLHPVYNKLKTKIAYRQHKFNLLREESEGFSKVFTELNNITLSNIESIMRNVQLIIGYYHIDPNRVHDIILDIIESFLDDSGEKDNDLLYNKECAILLLSFVKQNERKFDVNKLTEMLRFKLNNERNNKNDVSNPADQSKDKEKQIHIPKSLFKLASLMIVDEVKSAKNENDITVESITLNAIIPDLQPNLAKLQEYAMTEQKQLEQAMRANSSLNWKVAVHKARAKILTTDSEKEESTTKTPKEEEENESRLLKQLEETDEISNLIAYLIQDGGWFSVVRPFLDKLSKSPDYYMVPEYILDHPQVLESIKRFIEGGISELHSTLFPEYSILKSSLPTSATGIGASILKLAYKSNATISSLKIKNLDEFRDTIIPTLQYISPHRLMQYPTEILLKITKITGLVIDSIDEYEKKEIYIKDLLLGLLLPCLSLQLTHFPAFIDAIWENSVKKMHAPARYDVYQKWMAANPKIFKKFKSSYKTRLIVSSVRNVACAESRKALKRGALEEKVFKHFRLLISKYLSTNPIDAVIGMIFSSQNFEALINVVVLALHQSSGLEIDIFSFLLVFALNKYDDNRKIKEEGEFHEEWHESTCKLIGTFYQHFPDAEMSGFIGHLQKHIENGTESADIHALDNILLKVCGIEFSSELSSDNLNLFIGGNKLRALARLRIASSTEASKTNKSNQITKSAEKFGKYIAQTGSLVQLSIKLATLRHLQMFPENEISDYYGIKSSRQNSVSYNAWMFERITRVFMKYSEFLSAYIPLEILQSFFPKRLIFLRSHLSSVSLDPSILFHIARPLISNTLKKAIEIESELSKAEESPSSSTLREQLVNLRSNSPWYPTSSLIIDDVKTMLNVLAAAPSDIEGQQGSSITTPSVSPILFSLFYSLSCYDIYTPVSAYESQLKSVDKVASEEFEKEMQKHKDHVEKVDNLILSKKEELWLASSESENELMMRDFIQYCILPRLLLSNEDALYCIKFVEKLHILDIPRFSILSFIDLAVLDIPFSLIASTGDESANIALFLREMFSLLQLWKELSNEEYIQTCQSKPGFQVIKFFVPIIDDNFQQPPTSSSDENVSMEFAENKNESQPDMETESTIPVEQSEASASASESTHVTIEYLSKLHQAWLSHLSKAFSKIIVSNIPRTQYSALYALSTLDNLFHSYPAALEHMKLALYYLKEGNCPKETKVLVGRCFAKLMQQERTFKSQEQTADANSIVQESIKSDQATPPLPSPSSDAAENQPSNKREREEEEEEQETENHGEDNDDANEGDEKDGEKQESKKQKVKEDVVSIDKDEVPLPIGESIQNAATTIDEKSKQKSSSLSSTSDTNQAKGSQVKQINSAQSWSQLSKQPRRSPSPAGPDINANKDQQRSMPLARDGRRGNSSSRGRGDNSSSTNAGSISNQDREYQSRSRPPQSSSSSYDDQSRRYPANPRDNYDNSNNRYQRGGGYRDNRSSTFSNRTLTNESRDNTQNNQRSNSSEASKNNQSTSSTSTSASASGNQQQDTRRDETERRHQNQSWRNDSSNRGRGSGYSNNSGSGNTSR